MCSALQRLVPVHPVHTVGAIRKFFDTASREQRRDNLVTQLRRGRVHLEIFDRIHVAEGQQLLVDSEGRRYLVEQGPPKDFRLAMRPAGNSLKYKWSDSTEPPKQPSAEASAEGNRLAQYLFEMHSYIAPLFRDKRFELGVQERLTPSLRERLPGGVAVEVRPSLSRPNGLKGVLYETRKNGKTVIELYLAKADRALTITDELGRTATARESTWSTGRMDPFRPAAPEDRAFADKILSAQKAHALQVQGFKDSLKFGTKLLYYPYAAGARALAYALAEREFAGKRVLDARPHWIIRDGIPALVYLLLVETGSHPAMLLVSLVEEEDDENIYLDPYLAESEKLLGPKPEGITLFVDGVQEDDPLSGVSKQIFDRTHAGKPDARYAHVSDVDELVKAIQSVRRETGKSIARLEYFGHGVTATTLSNRVPDVGTILIGNDDLTADPEGLKKIFEHNELLLQALRERGDLAEPTAEQKQRREKAMNRKIRAISSLPDMSGAFAPGAQVRFTSCEVGAAGCGEVFMKEFATKTIAPGGGKVATATLSIAVPDERLTPPKREEKRKQEAEDRAKYEEWKKKRTSLDEIKDSAEHQALQAAILPFETVVGISMVADNIFKEKPIKVLEFPKTGSR